ncbi:MAG: diguanylate cyclase [Deltaproteobacteria bacterium]|nr:diguanylate cyclase [Deltaproteobacteria bacterium]
MSTLEYTVHNIRRGFRVSWTFIFAGAFAAAFVGGAFTSFQSVSPIGVLPIALFGLWAVVFGIKAHRRFTSDVVLHATSRSRVDLELGLLLVVATHAVVQMAGGLGSPLYPLVFVLVAFLVVYTPQWVGFALVTAAISIEFALVSFGSTHADLFEVVVHTIFIVFFALINLVFTRTEVARMRRRTRRQVEEAKAAMASDARDFRLTVPARGMTVLSREEEAARLSRSSVGEVRRSMYHHVDLLKRTMGLHTCVVLWLDDRSESLRVLECVSDHAEKVTARNIVRGEGVLGAIMQSKKPLRLKGLRPGYPGLPYYGDAVPVTDFLGVPVTEGESLRGVLCADRCDENEFNEKECQTLVASVESLLQIISNERVFNQLQKAKSEQGKLLAASEQLADTLTETDVVGAALDAAGQIAHFDIAAVALVDKNGLVVHKAVGSGAEEIEGIRVSSRSGLAAAALKNRHFLPYRGEFDAKQQIVFGKKEQKVFSKMRSAMVLPLVAGDTPLGTLVLAAATPAAYGEDVRTTLQVMINQLGTALQNARMVKRLEEMATTDALTSLANRRVFFEELEKKFASASRFRKELSIILCDVDHFKGVNDKYGHPVGDVVLKGFGDTLRRNVVRDTDMPARYGGEEFVVLCEGTSVVGATKLAERIRKDLESQVFHTEQGDLQVTISMGVATFPAHALSHEDLVERADAALYTAKESGRNQVCTWRKGT